MTLGGLSDGQEDVVQLLARIFQMCDVERRGQISIDDLLQLGQSYLGQGTNKVIITLAFKVNNQHPRHAGCISKACLKVLIMSDKFDNLLKMRTLAGCVCL